MQGKVMNCGGGGSCGTCIVEVNSFEDPRVCKHIYPFFFFFYQRQVQLSSEIVMNRSKPPDRIVPFVLRSFPRLFLVLRIEHRITG